GLRVRPKGECGFGGRGRRCCCHSGSASRLVRKENLANEASCGKTFPRKSMSIPPYGRIRHYRGKRLAQLFPPLSEERNLFYFSERELALLLLALGAVRQFW